MGTWGHYSCNVFVLLFVEIVGNGKIENRQQQPKTYWLNKE